METNLSSLLKKSPPFKSQSHGISSRAWHFSCHRCFELFRIVLPIISQNNPPFWLFSGGSIPADAAPGGLGAFPGNPDHARKPEKFPKSVIKCLSLALPSPDCVLQSGEGPGVRRLFLVVLRHRSRATRKNGDSGPRQSTLTIKPSIRMDSSPSP
jgi:hypothetical protein